MPVLTMINKGRVPVTIFTDDVDPKALGQLANIASLPFVYGHIAAMPDGDAGRRCRTAMPDVHLCCASRAEAPRASTPARPSQPT